MLPHDLWVRPIERGQVHTGWMRAPLRPGLSCLDHVLLMCAFKLPGGVAREMKAIDSNVRREPIFDFIFKVIEVDGLFGSGMRIMHDDDVMIYVHARRSRNRLLHKCVV